jgi:hypothetical protein
MGKFEEKIPEYIKQIELDIKSRAAEKYDVEKPHDCDCEFCEIDYDDELAEKSEEEIKVIEDDIAQMTLTLNRLKRHRDLVIKAKSTKVIS